MMDVKTLNSVFSECNTKALANYPSFLAVNIQRLLSLHIHVQVKFLHGQDIVDASILPILSKIYQDYTAYSSEIGAEDKDAKSVFTPVIFNSPEKFIPLLSYWSVVISSMKSTVDKSKLDCLLRSRHSYMLEQRDALVANSFKDRVADITMNGSTFTDNNSHAYDVLVPGISGTLAEQVLIANIKNENDFRGFYEAFQDKFMGAVSMTRLIMISTTDVSIYSRFTSHKGNDHATYIHNRYSHYEFLDTHADEIFYDKSKATALIGACKDTPWVQLSFTVTLSTTVIIGSYEANKNHLISHVPDNTIASRSRASIVQVAKIHQKRQRVTGTLMSHI